MGTTQRWQAPLGAASVPSVNNISARIDAGAFDTVVTEVRDWVALDPRAAFADEGVKRWLGMRWKDLFLREAVQDPAALDVAGKPVGLGRVVTNPFSSDKRSDRQRIADRFLKSITAADWQTELPDPEPLAIENTQLLLCPGLLTGILHPGAHAFIDERAFSANSTHFSRFVSSAGCRMK